jgi:CrcB protein
MTRFLLVCLGGAVGTGARYAVGGWAASRFGAGFPVGTLAINAMGSFAISVVMYLGLTAGALSADVRVFLAVGVLGGFTTYSSFNYEALALVQRGAWLMGLLYMGGTVAVCLAAGVLGFAAARWTWGG